MTHAPETTAPRHGCIIMASGMGTRFGSNKLMAELDGKPLIQHVIQATDGLFAKRVVVTRHQDVADLCQELGVQALLHDEPHRDGAVRVGMEALRASTGDDDPDANNGTAENAASSAINSAARSKAESSLTSITFIQGDQPLISANSISLLLRAAEDDPDSIWRTSFQGQHGAPVLFPTWAFDELRTLPPSKGGGFVAKAHADRVRTIEVASEWELFDVDIQNDLLALKKRLEVCDF